MSIINISQQDIYVDVSFYDDDEKQKLLKYPTASSMQQLDNSPVVIPVAEFLTYYLFHRKTFRKPGYQNYQSIGQKVGTSLAYLEDCIDFNGQSICTSEGVDAQIKEITEHIGEAIGLSVASRIHGLTEADWEPIPAKGGRGALPSLDFQIASDGENIIQVENKGSSVKDNRQHDNSTKAQYRKIIKKKDKLLNLPSGKKDLNPASLRYGTITAVDPRQDGNVRCWLTDPPPEQVLEDPKSFRLLQRMHFLYGWIGFISPRSQLSSALATRIADLTAISDPFELDGVPLLRGNGKPFDYGVPNVFGATSIFFANKSHISDGPAGGVVVQISTQELMLLGMREELVTLASKQTFDSIIEYSANVGSIEKNVKCIFSKSRFLRLRLPPSLIERATDSGGYVSFQLSGTIHYTSGGLVFGILDLQD